MRRIGFRSGGGVRVFFYGAVFKGSRDQCFFLDRDGIVHQLDPDRREAH